MVSVRCGTSPDNTLADRERASFVLSEALNWGLVPPTALRDGPHGIGSVQWFVPHDPSENYFTFGDRVQAQAQASRAVRLHHQQRRP
ncbi:MAG: hypothetical protein HND48_26790 [Chloroflexi bacterium]|nr:hypothetical protein [Chloroflexota bacterium]